jgi:hypothetical protein
MPIYIVEIEETSIKTYNIKAANPNIARAKALDRYEDSDPGDDPKWIDRGDYTIYNVTKIS